METYIWGVKGEYVRDLQKALIGLGYGLAKWGADGSLGDETLAAMKKFAVDHNYSMGDGIGRESHVGEIAKGVLLLYFAQVQGKPPILIDLTKQHNGAYCHGPRAWASIDAIVLHQTGCLMPISKAGWFSLRAHIGIPATLTPNIYLVNPIRQLIWHANGFNARSVGIEISGNYEGLDGDKRTWWQQGKGPSVAMESQIEAARQAVAWIKDQVEKNGGKVPYIFAHRQSSKDRIGDPGQVLWHKVGVWAMETLGLSDGGPGFKNGSGRPIPAAWCGLPGYEGYGYW